MNSRQLESHLYIYFHWQLYPSLCLCLDSELDWRLRSKLYSYMPSQLQSQLRLRLERLYDLDLPIQDK